MSCYAFPGNSEYGGREFGMTLRDYFAAKVMQGIVTRTDSTFSIDTSLFGEKQALIAYAIADAMLMARSK